MIEVDGPIYDVEAWVAAHVDSIQHFEPDTEVVVQAENIDLVLRRDSPDSIFGKSRSVSKSTGHDRMFNFLTSGQMHGYSLGDETKLSAYWELSVGQLNGVYSFFGGTLLNAVGCSEGGAIPDEHYEDHLLRLEYPTATYDWTYLAHDRQLSDHAGSLIVLPEDIMYQLLNQASVLNDSSKFCDIFDKFTAYAMLHAGQYYEANAGRITKKELKRTRALFLRAARRAFGADTDQSSVVDAVERQVDLLSPLIPKAHDYFTPVLS